MPLNRGSVSIEQIDRVEDTIYIDYLEHDDGVLNAENADGIAIPKFSTEPDVPATVPEGTIVYVESTGSLHFWNGESAIEVNSGSQFTTEDAQDATSSLLSEGNSISLEYNDNSDTLEVSVNSGPGSGLDSDTVDGKEADDLLSKENGSFLGRLDGSSAESLLFPTYPDTDSVPPLNEGSVVYIESEKSLFVEDGS
jgi:hypothetical protein